MKKTKVEKPPKIDSTILFLETIKEVSKWSKSKVLTNPAWIRTYLKPLVDQLSK